MVLKLENYNMKKITIIDYGCGNILSISRALEKIGYSSLFSKDKNEIIESDFLILPGVGSFKQAMSLLNKDNLKYIIKQAVLDKRIPLLGICLGMQILLTKSFEEGKFEGLNLIEGEVVKIKSLKNNKIPIPNINWCNLNFKNNIKENFIELEDKSFYFIHSYMAITKNIENTIATAKYKNVNIPSVIKSKNIIGCQFHPEKSGQNGLNFLKKIIKLYE